MTVVYAEAETVLTTWLRSAFPAARVVTELPSGLVAALPVIQVTRFGGADEVLTFDDADVDIDVYAASRDAARTLGEQVRVSLRMDLPGHVVAGAAVMRVQTISAPSWTPYTNTALRRFTSSYRVRFQSIQGVTP